jgi:hypothetical protein
MEFVQKDLFGADELPASTGIPEAPPLASETVAGALEPAPASRNGRDSRVGGAAGPSWTGDAVSFCIMAQGREVQAYITADALLTHFSVLVYGPDGPARAVAAYEENYVSINVVAWKRFAETGREPIRIRTSDFED